MSEKKKEPEKLTPEAHQLVMAFERFLVEQGLNKEETADAARDNHDKVFMAIHLALVNLMGLIKRGEWDFILFKASLEPNTMIPVKVVVGGPVPKDN